MNPLVVVLGVLLVVIILMTLYSSFFSGSTTMVDKVNLLTGTPPDTPADKLDNATSPSRTYSIWVYVNTWTSNSKYKMIFGREGDIVLYLDKANSKLKCKIKPIGSDITAVNGTQTNASQLDKIIDITNDFPIQKWVFVTVVIDAANIADYYLDGKLVKSVKLEDVLVSTSNPIKYGGTNDTWIAKFKRTPKTLGPQDVWNMYAKENPGSNLSSAIGNYNVNLSILKDNAVSSSLSLF
jgi:hypothetical protein